MSNFGIYLWPIFMTKNRIFMKYDFLFQTWKYPGVSAECTQPAHWKQRDIGKKNPARTPVNKQ